MPDDFTKRPAFTVEAINLQARTACMTSMKLIPITKLYDRDGAETDDPAAAISFVAGPDEHGRWWADVVDAYGTVTRN